MKNWTEMYEHHLAHESPALLKLKVGKRVQLLSMIYIK